MQGKQSQLRDIMDENGEPTYDRGRPSDAKKQGVRAAIKVAQKRKKTPVKLEPKKPKDDDLDDLFGEEPAPVTEEKSLTDIAKNSTSMITTEVKAINMVVQYGLTTMSLSKVFSLDQRTVVDRLSTVKPTGLVNGNPTYLIRDVARYLTEMPSHITDKDIRTYLIKTKARALPPTIQKDFWDAMIKQQKFEEAAGDLWRTEKVMLVLAEAFKKIKESSQLWVENIERTEGLTDEQRRILQNSVDGLCDEVYMTLVEMRTETETTNALDDTNKELAGE